MTSTTPVVTLSPRDYDAFLFDLDGVLTKTASVHAAAWKKLFDEFLRQHAAETRTAFAPFDIDTDYRRYVDGKPRYDGGASFLQSRGIELASGLPGDQAGAQRGPGPGSDGVAGAPPARGIELPSGLPGDQPEAQTVHALGKLKDRYFLEHLS